MPKSYAPYTKIPQLIRIDLRGPIENLQSSPTPLPTTEPTTPQIVWTISENDLPISNVSINGTYVALIYAAGKNESTASQTLYWRMRKNGVSIANGSASISAANFWTLNARYLGVSVGDVLEINLWASNSSVNWDYDARQLQISRIYTDESLNMPCYTSFNVLFEPTLLKGNPSVQATNNLYIYHLDGVFANISSPASYDIIVPRATFGFCRIYYGDYNTPNTASINTSASYRPYYIRNVVVESIFIKIYKLW